MSSPSQRLRPSSSVPSVEFNTVARTPTPANARRRTNSHFTSTLFDAPHSRMTSQTPNHDAHPGDRAVESVTHSYASSLVWQIYGLKALKEYAEDQPRGLGAVDVDTEGPALCPEAIRKGVIVGEDRPLYKLDIGE